MPRKSISYIRRSSVPDIKHYSVSKKPIFSKRVTEPKFHSKVRLEGYVWDYRKRKWKRENRYVTLAHNELMSKKEIGKEAENICQQTSEQFQIRKSTVVDARRNPIYE